jgi:hypothetical protein
MPMTDHRAEVLADERRWAQKFAELGASPSDYICLQFSRGRETRRHHYSSMIGRNHIDNRQPRLRLRVVK